MVAYLEGGRRTAVKGTAQGCYGKLMPKRRRKRRTVLKDSPGPVDIHVGARVRERRVSLGMTLRKLGDYFGLPFQQIQKYERGANRISASNLWAISHIFGVPIEWFFEGLGEPSKEREEVMSRPEARQLVGYYLACPPLFRDRFRALIRATADMRGKGSRKKGQGK